MNYYARPEVSNSNLSWLKDQLSGVDRPDPTNPFKFGRLIDCMITEPEKVNYFNYTCGEDQHTKEDFGIAEKMKKSFFKDPLCQLLVKHAEFQKEMIRKDVSFRFNSLEFKLDCRCKWDLWLQNQNFGGDIKSTTATTEEGFKKACDFFDYDRQRAWYMNIAGSRKDVIIGISKENFKVFKVFIEFGDPFFVSGVQKYEYLAFEWFKRFGEIDNGKN